MRALAAALLAVTLLLSACGGGGREPEAPSPAPSPWPEGASPAPQVEAGGPLAEAAPAPEKPEAQVVLRGPVGTNHVALTFDTGVVAGHTAEVLDILRNQNVKATFAVTGQWAQVNPELLKRILAEGHALINHSWDHASFTGASTETPPLSHEQRLEQVNRTEEVVQKVAGVSTKPYFRPPYGDFDPVLNQELRELGYEYNVMWGLDGDGWQGYSADRIARTALTRLYAGAIYLFHVDPHSQEYAALERIIEGIRAAGLMPVTIPQMLGKEPAPTEWPLPLIAAPAEAPPPPPPPAAPPPEAAPTPAPTPTPTPTPAPSCPALAWDGFESGSGGGCGWLGPWMLSGVLGVSGGSPHGGSWQADLSSPVLLSRSLDLTGRQGVHLRFWARLSSLEDTDTAMVMVSSDGFNRQTVKRFTAAEADGVYRFYDIDLSGFAMTSGFTVYFYGMLDSASDQWLLDDVELAVVGP